MHYLYFNWKVNAKSLKSKILMIKEICSWLPPNHRQCLSLTHLTKVANSQVRAKHTLKETA